MFEGKSTLDERTCFLIENPQYSDTKIFKLVPWIGFLGGKFGRAWAMITLHYFTFKLIYVVVILSLAPEQLYFIKS